MDRWARTHIIPQIRPPPAPPERLAPERPSQLWADYCALNPHTSALLLMKTAPCPYFTKQERLRSLARLYSATTEKIWEERRP